MIYHDMGLHEYTVLCSSQLHMCILVMHYCRDKSLERIEKISRVNSTAVTTPVDNHAALITI